MPRPSNAAGRSRAPDAERGKRGYSVAVLPHAGAGRAVDNDGHVDAGAYVRTTEIAKAGLHEQNRLSDENRLDSVQEYVCISKG